MCLCCLDFACTCALGWLGPPPTVGRGRQPTNQTRSPLLAGKLRLGPRIGLIERHGNSKKAGRPLLKPDLCPRRIAVSPEVKGCFAHTSGSQSANRATILVSGVQSRDISSCQKFFGLWKVVCSSSRIVAKFVWYLELTTAVGAATHR